MPCTSTRGEQRGRGQRWRCAVQVACLLLIGLANTDGGPMCRSTACRSTAVQIYGCAEQVLPLSNLSLVLLQGAAGAAAPRAGELSGRQWGLAFRPGGVLLPNFHHARQHQFLCLKKGRCCRGSPFGEGSERVPSEGCDIAMDIAPDETVILLTLSLHHY